MQNYRLKYKILLLFLIFLPTSVFAAKQIQGTVPTTTPVFQSPPDVYPNVSQNVQRTDPDFPLEEANGEIPAETSEPTVEGETGNPGVNPGPQAVKKSGFPVFKILLALVALGGLVWLYAKARKK